MKRSLFTLSYLLIVGTCAINLYTFACSIY